MTPRESVFAGCILGTALGDAVGLPCEGLSRARQRKLFRGGLPTLFFGRRMISDDTEHTILVAQALIESHGDVKKFERAFAKGLRRWFLLLPPGVGLATVKACLKLCVGISPAKSGVASAGNGAAMRAAILGVWCEDIGQLREFVQISSRITHTDSRAIDGAFAVALAAFLAKSQTRIDAFEYSKHLSRHIEPRNEMIDLVDRVAQSVNDGETTLDFATKLCGERGVSGYVLQTVPVALHAWLSHQNDFRGAVTSAVACGGDTDSVAAIVGGILGAQNGREALPQDWLDSLSEWPRDVRWMENLAQVLARNDVPTKDVRAPRDFALWLWLRNLFLLIVVLLHGFRRLFPPY